MAFACDITRVATLQFSASTNNRPYPFLQYNGSPIVDDEHILGHQPDEDAVAWGKLRVIRQWYAEQLAYLLGKLEAVPEGEGTMLDNTIIMLGSELSRGNTHSHMEAPFILAGGGGEFAMGRNLDFSNGGTDVFAAIRARWEARSAHARGRHRDSIGAASATCSLPSGPATRVRRNRDGMPTSR